MPRKAINYDKACIYDIEKDGVVYYVGSTTNFTKRKNGHKTACNNEKNKEYHHKIYQYIRDNGGFDSFQMVLIEYFKCNDANELRAREQHFINEFKTHLMNIIHASRSKKQYQIDKKVDIAITKSKHYDNNKVKIAIRDAKYYENSKVKIAIRDAKKYENNKAELLVKSSKYHKDNKEKIAIQKSKRYYEKKATKLLFKILPFH